MVRPSAAHAHHVRQPLAVPQFHARGFRQLPRGNREIRRADDHRNVASVVFRARVGLLHGGVAHRARVVFALDGVGFAAAHGENVHALVAAFHRHLDVPKAIVPEYLRHVFLKLEARQPQTAVRAVAPAGHQPPEPAKGPRQQHKRMLRQPQQLCSGDAVEIGETKFIFISFCEGERVWKNEEE